MDPMEKARLMAEQRLAQAGQGMPQDGMQDMPQSGDNGELQVMGMGDRQVMNELDGESERGADMGGGDVAYGNGSVMTEERINKAVQTLRKYKAGKASVENRIISAEQWWKGHNWDEAEKDGTTEDLTGRRTGTNWLWNSIVGKHADAMAAFPEPVILPRALDDKQEAEQLSAIVPVVMSACDFEQVYNDETWRKMREGTACYGVFWDKNAGEGSGDVTIKGINLLNLYWEPGITDIQDSRNVFYVSLVDNDVLDEQYPELAGKSKSSGLTVSKYQYDDHVDVSDKSMVVDWYYKRWEGGRQILHYCKFVGDHVLYATEDDQELAGSGLYDDGNYPFVMDPLYPVEGSPCGYGYIDICKDSQVDIDLMNEAIVQNTILSSNPRYFIRKDSGINEQEFLDVTRPFVHTSGNLGADNLQPIAVTPVGGSALSMLERKIEQLKFVTGNNDVNNGGTAGATAASAIAALQEASGRTSRDSTKSAYRSYKKIVLMVIERIRQFYDMPRQFRITGDMGQQEFVSYDNSGIQPQYQGNDFGVDMGYRIPLFDIDVIAQSETAYTKLAQNELAIQLMNLGVFVPQNADVAMMLLDMMDFKGKSELQQKIQKNSVLTQMLNQFQQIALGLAQEHDPAMADQLAQIILQTTQGAAQGMMPQQGAAPAQMPTEDGVQPAMDNGDKRSDNIRNNAAARSAGSIMP